MKLTNRIKDLLELGEKQLDGKEKTLVKQQMDYAARMYDQAKERQMEARKSGNKENYKKEEKTMAAWNKRYMKYRNQLAGKDTI